ncbi:MAG TPA: diaminopimelate epimerase [Syntrophobacteraceae bacterium]|nr:diaminopimelate epimerase [Syntrophobacteraceae bacterium]HBZ57461.1 diaminopimelate epimerase [Syntrophobacteraceae bacterium]
MTGSGNDFILIDNRNGKIDSDRCRDLVKKSCRRKLSVGADGLILIENDPEVDFRWRFFNADGSEAEMCGNGARCAARFAYLNGIVTKERLAFRTMAGVIEAEILEDKVRIQATSPRELMLNLTIESDGRTFLVHFVNTGVPHVVILLNSVADLEATEVFRWGRALRYHEHFQPAGTNVNFIAVQDAHQLMVRTYERGVEDETLACGTGAIASALITAAHQRVTSPVQVLTRSQEILTIHFQRQGSDFDDVRLEGAAKVVYEARLWDETIRS